MHECLINFGLTPNADSRLCMRNGDTPAYFELIQRVNCFILRPAHICLATQRCKLSLEARASFLFGQLSTRHHQQTTELLNINTQHKRIEWEKSAAHSLSPSAEFIMEAQQQQQARGEPFLCRDIKNLHALHLTALAFYCDAALEHRLRGTSRIRIIMKIRISIQGRLFRSRHVITGRVSGVRLWMKSCNARASFDVAGCEIFISKGSRLYLMRLNLKRADCSIEWL